MGDQKISTVVTALADRAIDVRQVAKLGMEGVKDSGIIEHWITAALFAVIKMVRPIFEIAASGLDDLLAVATDVFTASQGLHSHGFYILSGHLMTDLLGVEVDGEKLWNDFKTGGRQAAMRDLGGALFNTLAGEFTGVVQTTAGGDFNMPRGKGIGGLPDVKLTPQGGLDGCRALIGYITSFAIREGNTDVLASLIPKGYGEFFKDFAEDFSKGLGIGRLLRPALKNLIAVTIANPMLQALNMQYRPTIFDAKQAHAAWVQQIISADQLKAILAMHGWNDSLMGELQWEHTAKPTRAELRDAHILGIMPDFEYLTWMRRLGYTDDVTTTLDAMLDAVPLRMIALRTAEGWASNYLHGKITSVQYTGLIDSIRHTALGTPLLSDNEIAAFKNTPSFASATPKRHLSVAQLNRHYEDGLITLQEYEAAVSALGYDVDAVTELVQELLLSAKRASDRAARAAALAARGPLARLTVAQMEAGFTAGIFHLAEIEAELIARKYAPDAVAALLTEFRIKAGLQTPGTPLP